MTRSKPIIAVVFYSTYGHIEKLSEKIIEGAKAGGAEVRPYVLYVVLLAPQLYASPTPS
jgi:hypothetical protein